MKIYLKISGSEYTYIINKVVDGTVYVSCSRDEKNYRNWGTYTEEQFKSQYIEVSSVEEAIQIGTSMSSLEKASDENMPVIKDNVNALKNAVSSIEARKQELLRQTASFELVLQRRKREMDLIRSDLNSKVAEMSKVVAKCNKMIYTLELYQGIHEHIIVVQEGQKAPQDETLNLYQEKLFMDEEVGDPLQNMQGVDLNSIDVFIDYLKGYSEFYKMKHIDMFIPKPKGVMVVGVSRTKKNYGNPYISSIMNDENRRKTYFLIRNGDCIYLLDADISVTRLFPAKEELSDYLAIIDYIENVDLKAIGQIPERFKKYGVHNYLSQSDKDRIDSDIFKYKQQMIVIQGILDREDLFGFSKGEIDLFNIHPDEKRINFIYETELKLSDGRETFKSFVKKLNSQITVGSRIFLCGSSILERKDIEYKDRLSKTYQFSDKWSIPNSPNEGVYIVEEYQTEEYVYIHKRFETLDEAYNELGDVVKSYSKHGSYFCNDYSYNHENEKYQRVKDNRMVDLLSFPCELCINNSNGVIKPELVTITHKAIYYKPERYYDGSSRRISYKIFEDDGNILNYDLLTAEDVDYFLYDRRHRRGFLSIMPMMYQLRNQLENEKVLENQLTQGLVDDMFRQGYTIDEKIIKDEITKYKLKNKWKRSITSTDQEAWRIIKNRILRIMKKES